MHIKQTKIEHRLKFKHMLENLLGAQARIESHTPHYF